MLSYRAPSTLDVTVRPGPLIERKQPSNNQDGRLKQAPQQSPGRELGTRTVHPVIGGEGIRSMRPLSHSSQLGGDPVAPPDRQAAVQRSSPLYERGRTMDLLHGDLARSHNYNHLTTLVIWLVIKGKAHSLRLTLLFLQIHRDQPTHTNTFQ